MEHLPWICSWMSPHIRLGRLAKEFLFTLLILNPIEFRVAHLKYSVKKLWLD